MRAPVLLLVLIVGRALLPLPTRASPIDTEHLFAFMIGSDVGETGEREFQSESTGGFGKSGGTYRSFTQAAELEFVPLRNFRAEISAVAASYDIGAVAGLQDLRQAGLQGAALDLRYKLLDRDAAPFGVTVQTEVTAARMDDISGQHARGFGADVALAFDRELVRDKLVVAMNLLYQPERERLLSTDVLQQDAVLGGAFAVMAQLRPDVLVGAEARYLRDYDGLALETFAGHALFVGPTVFVKLSERARLTLAWSIQVAGRSAALPGPLDLVDFDRQQARLVYGCNF